MKKTLSLLTLGVLCSVIPATAQNAATQAATPGAIAAAMDSRAVPEVSLARLLQLDAAQIARLSRLMPPGAAPHAVRSGGDRQSSAALQKTAADWRSAQFKARASLSPVQRSQLDSLATDPRFRLRQDDLFWLLIAPAAPSSLARNGVPIAKSAPISSGLRSSDAQARRNWQDARRLDGAGALGLRGTGNYGVYGGYGYGGPQVGVYGGYQQGAIGVYGGLGRGGPSIGVNIGRVFGLGRR